MREGRCQGKVGEGVSERENGREYLLLLVSLGAVKADPDSCSQYRP